MKHLFVDTDRFRTGEICDGSLGIYKAFCRLLDISGDALHQQTVNHYFEHKKDDEYGWCNDVQRQTLAILYDIMICMICLKQNENNQQTVSIKFYGENSSSDKKFIYMRYDETTYNYYPLSVTNNENSNEEMTKLNYDDVVRELLRIYIEDEIKYAGEIGLGLNNALAPMDIEKTKENEYISDSMLMNPPVKRKAAELDGNSMPLYNDKPVPTENSDQVPNKRSKISEAVIDRIYKHKSETKEMEGLIQGDGTRDESDTDDIHENEKPTSPMALENEHHEQKESKNQCGDDICSMLT